MNDYFLSMQLNEISKAINEFKNDIIVLKNSVKPEEDLWDSSDIVRKWKVSERTLAEWRKMNMIGYVQIKKKIYYPRVAREKFLSENLKSGDSHE
jgi:hypothetical protein